MSYHHDELSREQLMAIPMVIWVLCLQVAATFTFIRMMLCHSVSIPEITLDFLTATFCKDNH